MTDSVGRAMTLYSLSSSSSSSKVFLLPVNVFLTVSFDCMSWMFDTIEFLLLLTFNTVFCAAGVDTRLRAGAVVVSTASSGLQNKNFESRSRAESEFKCFTVQHQAEKS